MTNPFGVYHYNLHQGIVNVALRAHLQKKEFVPLEECIKRTHDLWEG